MWSQENTEALKNKVAELKNKSLKKQSMEENSETELQFTHAERWDLSVRKILELESSLKEQGLEMAGLEKKISDLSDECCNQKRKNEDDYLAYQQTLKEKEAESKETQDGLLSYVFKKSMGKGISILALLIANIGQLVKLLKHRHENHMPPLEEYLLCVSIGLQVIAGILIIVEQKMIGQGSSFVKSRSGVILNAFILIILFLVILLNAYFGFGVSGLD